MKAVKVGSFDMIDNNNNNDSNNKHDNKLYVLIHRSVTENI